MQPPPPAPGPSGFDPPAPPPAPGGFTPPPPGTWGQPTRPAAKPTSTEAVVAIALAAVTMTTSCFPLGFVALYYGSKARKKAIEEGDAGGSSATLALVGMIVGGFFGVIWGLFWLLEAGIILFGVGMAVWHRPPP